MRRFVMPGLAVASVGLGSALLVNVATVVKLPAEQPSQSPSATGAATTPAMAPPSSKTAVVVFGDKPSVSWHTPTPSAPSSALVTPSAEASTTSATQAPAPSSATAQETTTTEAPPVTTTTEVPPPPNEEPAKPNDTPEGLK